jgi:uncharacterized membrane protein
VLGRQSHHRNLRELFFRVAVTLKGIDGFVETAAGVALLVVSPTWIAHTIASVTWHELIRHPDSLIVHSLYDAANRLSVGSEHFAAIYLIAHGVVKVGLVAGLLKDQRWAYPVAIIVFSAFVIYMFYRFTSTHGGLLIALALSDLVVIVLIWLEYRSLER